MLFGVGQKVLFLIVHRKFFDFCVRQHSNNREGSSTFMGCTNECQMSQKRARARACKFRGVVLPQ